MRGASPHAHPQVHPLNARSVSPYCTLHSHSHWLKFEPCPHSTHDHLRGHPRERSLFTLIHSSLCFPAFLLSVFLFPFLPPQRRAAAGAQQEDHGKPALLRDQRGKGTYDVLYLPTGFESNGHDFNELQNSSVPLSYKIPAADQDVDDLTLGEMLTEAYRGQVDYSVREGVSVSQSSSSSLSDRSGQPDECNSSKAQIRTLLDEQRQKVLAECHARVSHHELQAARAEEEQRLLQGQQLQQKLEFREAHQRSLTEMEELRKFQSSAFDTVARRKFLEDQDTIFELSGRVQALQNEVNCMNDSKDFQDAESIRSGNSHVTSRPVSFPPHPIPEGMLRHSFVSPRRREGPPSIWDTHGISGNVFVNPDASSSALYPQELHQWNSSIEEPLHSSTVEKSERQEQDQDLRCQSGPSAKNSVILSGGDSSKNYGADQQRLQISDLHFDKFLTPATFAGWKIRFKTEVCTCSQFRRWLIQWKI